MKLTKKRLLTASMCLVVLCQWFDGPLMVGGKAVMFVTELALYFHAGLLLLLTKGKLHFPKWIIRILLPLIIYFALHFVYSAVFLDVGNAILTTRRLVYYPFISIVIGYSTVVTIADTSIVHRVLRYMLYLSVALLLLNVGVRFHMFQEFGFISRATGVTLSALLFGFLLKLVKRQVIQKRDFWIGITAFLLIFITSSRGVYLAFFITTSLLVWQYRRHMGVVRITKLLAGGLVGLSIIGAIALSSTLVIETLGRFSTDTSNVLSGNMGSHGAEFNTLGARYYLYEAVFNLGMESPVFGKGSGYKVDEWHIGGTYNIDRSKTAHNHYLDIWYRLGAVGLLLFFLFYRNLLVELKKKQESVYYMMIVALIYSSFDVMLSSTISAIIPIFMLVGVSMYDYRLTIANK
ncbi:MAG: O-antigen ligase [Flammeovirgaceae bacterium]|jgi:O-antigen ligase